MGLDTWESRTRDLEEKKGITCEKEIMNYWNKVFLN